MVLRKLKAQQKKNSQQIKLMHRQNPKTPCSAQKLKQITFFLYLRTTQWL